MTRKGGRTLWHRRELLRTMGLTAATGALAGCEYATDNEFTADAVVLPPAAQSSLGFASIVEQSRRRTVERTVNGRDVTATIDRFVSVYAQTDGEMSWGDSESGPLLLRFSGGAVPFDGTTDRLFVGPATAFDTVGGTLPFLRDGVVDPRGVVLFAPGAALSGAVLDANEALAVAHRSALSEGPFVPTDTGFSVPDSAFFPNSVFDVDAEWFPNKNWILPDDDARSTVAVFPGPGVDSGAVGTAGRSFEAGTELDATYVAAPADVFFDTGVSVTDPGRLQTFLGTDADQLGAVAPERPIDDAGVVVFSDRERGVPFAYIPGETLFPDSTFFPEAVFSADRPILAASLGDLFLDSTFFPDSFTLSESLLNPQSLALFFPSEPVSSVPDPFTVVDSGANLSPSGTVLFFPTGPGTLGGADEGPFPDSAFYPDAVFAPDSLFWPDSVFWPDSALFPDAALLPMETNAHPATSAGLPVSFPSSFFFPGTTFSPTEVLHLPGDFGFSADLFENAGTEVTHARSATAEKQDAAEIDTAPLSLGVLSTPVASVAGQSINTLAGLSLSDLLTNDQAESFLRSAGVGDGSVEWARGPTRLGTEAASLLGEPVTMETHAGILDESNPSVVYLHLARVENGGSVVVSAGVHGFEVSDTDRPFVGADGYVSQDRLDRYRSTVVTADEALTVR
ncbi:DUF6517 family protein [Haloarcula pellucida]|uniref:Uncharacterized protein n=1 Tax=Haloarcula pellucida TaxID=1427151 RepID=A0A830GUB9_9EURY|nr:DUF6517 family protein [Halomicroarcula pellucida]MBX0349504.1 hypothetical protein [Halomicroarcula pellucida]GGO02631.1 hypothetical protein GCM10009030_37380 [Halomicroarcula pellucida]